MQSSLSLLGAIALIPPCYAWVGAGNTSTIHATGWESGTVNPFSSCNVESPAYTTPQSGSPVYDGSYKMTAYFSEDYYDGTRDRKGAEFCVFDYGTKTNHVNMYKEGWQGFAVYVSSTKFPTNKGTIIAQQFCPGGCSSWCGTISILNNTLALDHRPACGSATHAIIVNSIARDKWHTVVVHIRMSQQNNGMYQVWYDGSMVHNETSINVGFGDSWTDDTIDNGFYFKNGMYCYDVDEYTNSTRTLYFDDVTWYSTDDGQTDGLSVVTP